MSDPKDRDDADWNREEHGAMAEHAVAPEDEIETTPWGEY